MKGQGIIAPPSLGEPLYIPGFLLNHYHIAQCVAFLHKMNKRVSYRKQIAHQHSSHQYFGHGKGRGQPRKDLPLI